jgi:hypothetical protein
MDKVEKHYNFALNCYALVPGKSNSLQSLLSGFTAPRRLPDLHAVLRKIETIKLSHKLR